MFLKWPTSRASGASVSCVCCPSGALRFQHHLTRATAQRHVCLRPGVQAAVWTGVFCAHAGFPLRLPLPRGRRPRAIPPGDHKPLREEIRAGLRDRPTGHHVMAHMLPGTLAAWCPGMGGTEANGIHLGRPFSVMVGAAAGRATVMLPEMYHLI